MRSFIQYFNGTYKPILFLLSFLLIISCSSSNFIKKADIPHFRLIKSSISKEVKAVGNLSEPISLTREFYPNDHQIVSHISFAHLVGEHEIRWEWYTPEGDIFRHTENKALNSPEGEYVKEGVAWHALPLKDTNTAAFSGTWEVKIYIDDATVAAEQFLIHHMEADQLAKEISNIDFGNYYALVIGINKYKNLKRLISANQDAKDVASVLKEKYNFTVTLLQDATRSDIILALDNIRLNLTHEDNLLIYYAGHGVLDEEADEGYWLPKDAVRDNTLNWISNSRITNTIKAMAAKHVMVVADSCYAGKLVRSSQTIFDRGIEVTGHKRSYYASMLQKRARTVMCSGGLEPVMDTSGENGHSVFASAFIDALKKNKGVIEGTQLFDKIRRPVVLNSDQTPEYSDIRKAGHDGGDFLFVSQQLLEKVR